MGQDFGAPTQAKSGLPVWAWFVIVPCGCIALLIPVIAILAAVLFPVFAQAREKARQASCGSNIREQALGVRMYSEDYDERFPPAEKWMDQTATYVKNESPLHCPSVSEKGVSSYGYAYNNKLSRLPLAKVAVPATMTMLYDSTNLSRNAADAVTSLPNPGRHSQHNNLGYVDGHVKASDVTKVSQ